MQFINTMKGTLKKGCGDLRIYFGKPRKGITNKNKKNTLMNLIINAFYILF